MEVEISLFGQNEDKDIHLISMRNRTGNQVQIITLGGIIHSWTCFDKAGRKADVLLGCRDLSAYLSGHPYFGAIIGRYANRIDRGKLTIDGVNYQLNTNLPPHHLHGGVHGFDSKIWKHRVEIFNNYATVTLNAESKHMEEGYPGHLTLEVKYSLTDSNEIIMEFCAETDQTTCINMTNHCYFNLSGSDKTDILDHKIKINADYTTAISQSLIPTGEFIPVAGTNLDFRDFHLVSERIFSDDPALLATKGYDYNFILNRHEKESPVAQVIHPASGRRLQVFTDQPGIQLYTGNWLGGVVGKTGVYDDYAGFCLETQHFPDSPNHSNFPSTLLKPTEKYYTKTTYKMDVVLEN